MKKMWRVGRSGTGIRTGILKRNKRKFIMERKRGREGIEKVQE